MAGRYLIGDVTPTIQTLDDESIDVVFTSPPYWGGQRHYLPRTHPDAQLEIGHEKTPEEYVARLVEVFGAMRPKLRPWATVWLNIGDSYASYGNFGMKDLDLVGIPWLVAQALRADGWYLRASIIWAKASSYCPGHSGTTMPESIHGTRWERHRIKVVNGRRYDNEARRLEYENGTDHSHGESLHDPATGAKWIDCPGCSKCEANDGLVLIRGSWRPTRAHEYILFLTKGPDYFIDDYRVLERGVNSMRNPRNVWSATPKGISDRHYATFPVGIVRPALLAATSPHGGCPECGAPFAPVIHVDRPLPDGEEYQGKSAGADAQASTRRMLANVRARRKAGYLHESPDPPRELAGYRATCEHRPDVTSGRSMVVLDPFAGSGTVPMVAESIGCDWVAIDIDERNEAICRKRVGSLFFDEGDAVSAPPVQGGLFD